MPCSCLSWSVLMARVRDTAKTLSSCVMFETTKGIGTRILSHPGTEGNLQSLTDLFVGQTHFQMYSVDQSHSARCANYS